MYVRVDIDPDDVLGNMDLNEITDYMKNHFKRADILREFEEDPKVTINLVDSYWHGDLNISALLKELGPEETNKIFQEVSLS